VYFQGHLTQYKILDCAANEGVVGGISCHQLSQRYHRKRFADGVAVVVLPLKHPDPLLHALQSVVKEHWNYKVDHPLSHLVLHRNPPATPTDKTPQLCEWRTDNAT
jgi:hypothetical protein